MTNYYGFPPGYDPNPHHPRQVPAEAAPADIPANVKRRAADAGATHISSDGKRAYVKRFEQWHQMDWLGTEWGCWWTIGGEPEGMVTL